MAIVIIRTIITNINTAGFFAMTPEREASCDTASREAGLRLSRVKSGSPPRCVYAGSLFRVRKVLFVWHATGITSVHQGRNGEKCKPLPVVLQLWTFLKLCWNLSKANLCHCESEYFSQYCSKVTKFSKISNNVIRTRGSPFSDDERNGLPPSGRIFAYVGWVVSGCEVCANKFSTNFLWRRFKLSGKSQFREWIRQLGRF